MYEYPEIDKKMPEGFIRTFADDETFYNPLLVTDEGDYIWGIESDWVAKKDLEGIPEDMIPDILIGASNLEQYLRIRAISDEADLLGYSRN